MDTADKVTQALTATIGRDHAMLAEEATELATISAQAVELVAHHIGTATVPAPIVELASLEVARELYTRRDAPGGVLSTFGDVGPIRLARDPMKAAYPILGPYLGGGFA